jgi:hypothetical protein
MKRLSIFAVSVLVVSYVTIAGAATQPTPIANTSGKALSPHPLLHQVNLEMKQQWQKIMIDQKAGKLTPEHDLPPLFAPLIKSHYRASFLVPTTA